MYYEDPTRSPYLEWQEIDIIVSRDCLLRCKYCYLHKQKDTGYDLDKIINGVDKILQMKEKDPKCPGVAFGLYPEPWVNLSRTNEIMIRVLELLLKYPKFINNYMFSLGTCGVGLHNELPLLKEIPNHISIQVTIDGIKEHHDLYRVFKNGSGSFDKVKENILKYQNSYNLKSTKVTIGPDTIKYIFESTLFLWNEMNFEAIHMNVVYEDLWGTEYEKLHLLNQFEDQLKKLTNYILTDQNYKKKYISLLGENLIPRNAERQNNLYCGAAVMRSIDSDGSIYPCFRLSPYSLKENKTFKLEDGNENSNALKILDITCSSPKKCLDCPLLNVCSMCVGHAYEDGHTLFHRTTSHCEFVKLQHKYAKIIHDAIDRMESNNG